ncbi:MAG: hypothetical protein M3434_02645 [Gemmatimonadota bacterium]|nr:hypothetical protein [Gemmatimonadota bacterium]
MSRILALVLVLCAACNPVERAELPPDGSSLAFTRVNVVDVESARVLPNQTVLIAGNRIQAVGSSARVKIPSGAQVVDATGKYLIPGLWDMHLHVVDPDTPGSPDASARPGERSHARGSGRDVPAKHHRQAHPGMARPASDARAEGRAAVVPDDAQEHRIARTALSRRGASPE